ncbi:uncharacterized protein LOC113229967 [Hyposmocoma kahamanoa]|uniref:uncharacterized protein LOC113229967 n=1 Tax=Hyposmocoma kahamanoa TaxID=1477025 RepID=UPI000E6D6E9B|nr:uncharacterized protein LOC113229967 [Hyposmocoma kahamanoa]
MGLDACQDHRYCLAARIPKPFLFITTTPMTKKTMFASTAPRVVLIHREFAIGTIDSLINLPKHHKLGDVTFGDYKQDEDDCKLSQKQAKMGLKCPRAYMIMPISFVIPHPEYRAIRVKDSIALVKFIRPLGSDYMMPLCLPNLMARKTLQKKAIFMVDYVSI